MEKTALAQGKRSMAKTALIALLLIAALVGVVGIMSHAFATSSDEQSEGTAELASTVVETEILMDSSPLVDKFDPSKASNINTEVTKVGGTISYALYDSIANRWITPTTGSSGRQEFSDLVLGREYDEYLYFEAPKDSEESYTYSFVSGSYYYVIPDGMEITNTDPVYFCADDEEKTVLGVGFNTTATINGKTEKILAMYFQAAVTKAEFQQTSLKTSTDPAKCEYSINDSGKLSTLKSTDTTLSNPFTITAEIGAYGGMEYRKWSISDVSAIGQKFSDFEDTQLTVKLTIDGQSEPITLYNAANGGASFADQYAYIIDNNTLYLICKKDNNCLSGAEVAGLPTTAAEYTYYWTLQKKSNVTIFFNESIAVTNLMNANPSGDLKHISTLLGVSSTSGMDNYSRTATWEAQVATKTSSDVSSTGEFNYTIDFNSGQEKIDWSKYEDLDAEGNNKGIPIEDSATDVLFVRDSFRVVKVLADKTEVELTENVDYTFESFKNTLDESTGPNAQGAKASFTLRLMPSSVENCEILITYSAQAIGKGNSQTANPSNTACVGNYGKSTWTNGSKQARSAKAMASAAKMKIAIQKTDAENTSEYVPGAKYGLFRASDNKQIGAAATTDDEGKIIFSGDVSKCVFIQCDNYYVQELEAAPGYNLETDSSGEVVKHAITVKYDDYGIMRAYDASGNVFSTSAPLSVTDTPKYALKLFKAKDKAEDHSNGEHTDECGLAGAEFALYTDTGCEHLATYYDSPTSTTPASNLTTNSDGYVEFYGLASGKYYLKELVTPAGYQLLEGVITIEIKNDPTMTYQTKTDNLKWEWGTTGESKVRFAKEIGITITDIAVPNLPITGAAFDWAGFGGKALGVLLIGGAVGYFIYRRKFALQPKHACPTLSMDTKSNSYSRVLSNRKIVHRRH